jgi:competence protein ComEC
MVCLLFFCLMIGVWYFRPARTNLEIDFLAVGQGDAILIKTLAGQNILIDGGPDKTVLRKLSENLPWWDRQIDLMILTHPHDDHVIGLNAVLGRYRVRQAVYTGLKYESPAYQAWLDSVKQKNISLVIIDQPQKIMLGKNIFLDILFPRTHLAGQSLANANNSSIVMKLVDGNNEILLSGDAETPVWDELLKAKTDLQADLLKISHHGSDNGTNEQFLAAVGAKQAVIQVGQKNDFGHPSLRTLNKLKRAGMQIFRTDEVGTIIFTSDGTGLWPLQK